MSKAQEKKAVLADGDVYKIAITQTGVYKISAKTLKNTRFLSQNPQNIKLFGNGGGVLPQTNRLVNIDALPENAIMVVGEEDGSFDDNDYILFYGESPHKTLFDSTKKEFSHQINYYSDTTYYYLKISTEKGSRIQKKNAQIVAKADIVVDAFDDFYFHEAEQKNMVSSGREWYGEFLGLQSQLNFDVQMDSLLSNEPLKVRVSALGTALTASNLIVSINQHAIGSMKLSAIDAGRYDIKGYENTANFATNASSPLKIGFDFTQNTQTNGGAYLNYFEITAKRRLATFNKQTIIRNIESTKYQNTEFQLKNTDGTVKIWDITNPTQIAEQETKQVVSQVVFQANTQNILKTYILFSFNNLLENIKIEKISNQNLKAVAVPNLLIISSKKWKSEAERLANFRTQHDGLETLVVSNEEVYNEFSSGIADPTAIRNFVRFLWKQNPEKLKYLLLFADASFDYKNYLNLPNVITKDLIPCYESRESLHPINSFSSDDYFGFLEDTEGEWQESHQGNHSLDIGVGRLPVKTLAEATAVVDKLIYYATSKKTFGTWRTQLSFVADDGDGNIHQEDAEQLAESATNSNKNLRLNKIYLDAYPQVVQADGARIPEANKALNRAVSDGSLVVNYNGHGGIDGWAEEKLLTDETLLTWRNLNNMPLFLTATCEFGRYDNPNAVSGAELAILSPKGVAIALLTTARPVYANSNFLLNNAFYQIAMKNPHETLGNLMKYTKNNSFSGVLNRNFSLLGDPSMSLNYPQQNIIVKRINGQSPQKYQMKALSKVQIVGEIEQNTQFSGKIFVSIFDKKVEINTLGTKGDKMTYKQYKSKLFEGQVSVNKGQFEINFIVPKDIDYRLGNGKMYFYAINADSTQDALGSFDDFLVGGSEAITQTDNTSPTINLSVNDNKQLIAQIYDESGINISSNAIGHEMILTLNDTLQVLVNQYYRSIEDYRKGEILYDLSTLPAGKYTIQLKIWDVYNNSNTATLQFIAQEPRFQILVLNNYPNPFNTETIFQIKQNQIDDDLLFKLNIYDSKGDLIDTKEEYCYICPEVFEFNFSPKQENWHNGIYFYRIFANSLNKSITNSYSGKLMFLK